VLARQLADPVGGDRRAVGIGLVVEPGQGVDQIEVVAGDQFAVMVGSIAIGNLLGEGGFVEGRVVKSDRAGIDRLVDRPAISATTALESTPPDRKAPSGTSEIMRRRIDSRSFSLSCSQASSIDRLAVEAEAHVPVLFGSASGCPRRTVSMCAGGSFLA
jgi:hypothetical protein